MQNLITSSIPHEYSIDRSVLGLASHGVTVGKLVALDTYGLRTIRQVWIERQAHADLTHVPCIGQSFSDRIIAATNSAVVVANSILAIREMLAVDGHWVDDPESNASYHRLVTEVSVFLRPEGHNPARFVAELKARLDTGGWCYCPKCKGARLGA